MAEMMAAEICNWQHRDLQECDYDVMNIHQNVSKSE